MSYIPKEADMYHFALGGNLAVDNSLWEELKSPIGRAALNPFLHNQKGGSPYNFFRSNWQVRLYLAIPSAAVNIDNNLYNCPPPEELTQQKGDLEWSEWLRRSPRKGGSTNKQRAQLLEWNLEEMKARNREHGPGVSAKIDVFGDNLAAAVDDKIIDPAMLTRWQAIKDTITAVILPPITYLGSGGIAFIKQRSLFLDSDSTSQDFVSHELTHLLGGVGNRGVDEPLTDILAFAIDRKDLSQNTSIYLFASMVFDDIFRSSGIDARILSRHYTGTARRRNLRSLSTHTHQVTGDNVIKTYLHDIQERTKNAEGPIYGTAFAKASAQLLKERRNYASYREVLEILSKDHPLRSGFNDEDF